MSRILLVASALAAAAGIVLACSDEPVGPAAPDAVSPAASDAEREQMRVAPLVVEDQWMPALKDGDSR